MSELISLGIESTAHTFGVGIITEGGSVLANEKDVYHPPIGKGIIPEDAAKHHDQCKEAVFDAALKKASIDLNDVSVISYSCGAGLPPCLSVGANFTLALSQKNKIPLMQVCHQIGHIEIGKLTADAKDPIVVYLSGGNTQILGYNEGRYRIFGETQDIPIGNALDVLAREMGLPMPGGPEIEKLAVDGTYVELPYVVKGMDLSFSGILTAVRKMVGKVSNKDLAFSMQETCFSMLAEVAERALAHTGKNEILLVGGVALNRRLQKILGDMCNERGATFFVVPMEYGMDNGAMIAWAGMLAYKSGWKPQFNDKIRPKWRTDDVEVTWI